VIGIAQELAQMMIRDGGVRLNSVTITGKAGSVAECRQIAYSIGHRRW